MRLLCVLGITLLSHVTLVSAAGPGAIFSRRAGKPSQLQVLALASKTQAIARQAGRISRNSAIASKQSNGSDGRAGEEGFSEVPSTTGEAETLAQMVKEFPDHTLDLTDLADINVAVAKDLAEFKGETLRLNRLRVIDVDTAKALSQFKGERLALNGLNALDTNTAKALAQYKGEWLSLDGIRTLDAATAEALAQYKGQWLSLDGIRTLDAATAEALAQCGARVLLNAFVLPSFNAACVLWNCPNINARGYWNCLPLIIAAIVATVYVVVRIGMRSYSRRRLGTRVSEAGAAVGMPGQ
jgi:hypothetical protein